MSTRFFIPLFLILAMIMVSSSNLAKAKAKAINRHELKETQLTMYLHDNFTGPYATTVPIAGIADKVWTNYLQFGTLFVADDLITKGPHQDSATVGRGQGFSLTTALDGSKAYVALSIVFTNKKYNGSTLEIQGNSKQLQQVRELSVVSGTGKFRFARGFATLENYLLNSPPIGYSVTKWTVTVQHYG